MTLHDLFNYFWNDMPLHYWIYILSFVLLLRAILNSIATYDIGRKMMNKYSVHKVYQVETGSGLQERIGHITHDPIGPEGYSEGVIIRNKGRRLLVINAVILVVIVSIWLFVG